MKYLKYILHLWKYLFSKQSFPHQNILEADIYATELLEELFKKQFNYLSFKADLAYWRGDYKNHSIYCMAANKIAKYQALNKEELLDLNKYQGKLIKPCKDVVLPPTRPHLQSPLDLRREMI